jgi:hypothetical protein
MPHIDNATKPRLTIGARPLALDAHLAKIGVKNHGSHDDKIELADEAGRGTAPEGALSIDCLSKDREAARDGTAKPRRKFKPHPAASALPWPPRREWFPAVELEGNSVPDAG